MRIFDQGGVIAGRCRIAFEVLCDEHRSAMIWKTHQDQLPASDLRWCLELFTRWSIGQWKPTWWASSTADGWRCVPILRRIGGGRVRIHEQTRQPECFPVVSLCQYGPSDLELQDFMACAEYSVLRVVATVADVKRLLQ